MLTFFYLWQKYVIENTILLVVKPKLIWQIYKHFCLIKDRITQKILAMILKKITILILFVLLLAKFSSRYKSWEILSSGDSIVFSYDSEIIAYASGEIISRNISLYGNYSGSSTVELRKVSNKKIIQTFDFFSASSIAFSPNNRFIAVGGYGGEIKIWRIKDSQPIQTLKEAEHDKDITKQLVFTSNSKTLISSTISHSNSQYKNSNISV